MGHITSKNYKNLQKRLDSFAQGAPKSDALYNILEVLFSEEEARLVSKLPIIPYSHISKKAQYVSGHTGLRVRYITI